MFLSSMSFCLDNMLKLSNDNCHRNPNLPINAGLLANSCSRRLSGHISILNAESDWFCFSIITTASEVKRPDVAIIVTSTLGGSQSFICSRCNATSFGSILFVNQCLHWMITLCLIVPPKGSLYTRYTPLQWDCNWVGLTKDFRYDLIVSWETF